MKNRVYWNPDDGDALQGDVCLFRVPSALKLSTTDEIAPRDGRLILAEGEVTGHHHAIGLRMPQPAMLHDDALARATISKVTKKATIVSAKMYRDPAAVHVLQRAGELTDAGLCIGFLIVEGAPVALDHDEHDTIVVPPGRYYVGGQREMDADQERMVAD
jgi:hypothetical protein